MKLRFRCLLVTAAAIGLAVLAPSRALDQRSGDGGFSLDRSGDVYTLRARDARVADVLARLRELTDLKLDMDPRMEARVTASLDGAPIEKVLAALAQSRALVYERGPDEDERLVQARLTGQQGSVASADAAPARLGPGDLGRGVLTNTKRPLGELRRRGSPAILLGNAVIDTEAARRGEKLAVPARFAAPWDAEHQIVQFDRPVSDADRLRLAGMGIEITHYVPNAAFAVRARPEQIAALQNLPGVAHIEPYHPYFKMSRDVLAAVLGEADEAARARVESGKFNALSFRGSPAAGAIAAAGGEVLETQTVDGRERVTFQLPPDKLPDVLALPGVQWVEPDAPRRTLNDLANRRVRASSLRQSHPTLTGAGVTIGLTDSGIDFVHPTFALDPSLPTSTNLNTRIVAYHMDDGGPTSDGLPGDNDGHGTHVAGTILGNGALSDTVVKSPGSGAAPYGTNQFAGIAPAAKIVVIEDFNSFSDADQARLTLEAGARISNNSWGNTLFEYGALSAIWDALVLDADTNTAGRQELIAFFAAGNSGEGADDGTGGTAGTVGQPGNAKNVITIGAIEQRRKAYNLPGYELETDSDWQVASFSSRGPVTATDIRFKPDLVAPGAYVLSAQSHETLPDELIEPLLPHRDYRYDNVNSGTNYAFFSGTSMATPVAAGAGALFYQYYTNLFGVAPSPALMKAALVAGARMVNSLVYKMPYDSAIVDTIDQGFGLIDIKRSISGTALRPTDEIIYLDQTVTDAVGTEEIYSYQLPLQAGEGGLKIALAWNDPAGTPGNSFQLVNDIDLIVRAPGGGGYLGNQYDLDGVNSRKFTNPDPLYGDEYNNVESVVISDAPIGTYTIQVRGYQVSSAEKQPFALVIMKGIGIEGRTLGESVAMALDTNSKPVIAFAALDVGGQKQVYVKRWVGPYGDFSELDNWWRMEDQWAGYRHSAVKTGISRTLEDSEEPSVAVDGENVFVAWRERPREIGGTNVSRIFVRQWDGSDWIQLNGSAQDFGVPNSVSLNTFSPQIGVMSNGRPVVAWLQYSGVTTNKIHARVSVWDGADWVGLAGSHTNGLALSSTNTANVASALSLAINRLGRPVVAWKESAINNSISVRQWNGATWDSLNYSNALFFISDPKLVAADRSDDLFLAWRQQVSAPLPYAAHQIFAARRTGGSWSQMSGSATHPGVSATTNGVNAIYPYEPSISVGEIEGTTNVIVSWRAGTSNGNYILVRQWRPGQTNWVSLFGAGDVPGVDIWPEEAAAPVSVADRYGLPIVSFPLAADSNSIIATYTVISDREPPLFAGLQTAVGGTNGDVALGWLPAVDDISTTVYYRIYRGTQTFACGVSPSCDAGNVFSNLIATVTNLTSFTVTNLTANQVYCFGVRAVDTNGQMDANTVIRSAGPVSGAGDNDGDCLDNATEIAAGTEPCNKDTDEDGMWDGWEWTFSTNNLGKTNAISWLNTNIVFLNPVDNGADNVRTLTPGDGDAINLPGADPDGDGASNFEEFQWWQTVGGALCAITNVAVPAGPNPTAFDTDLDGMPDGWEMINGLDPINPADAAGDPDADGLTNLQEYQYGTDPNNPDSDGDGLSDGAEVTVHGTDPALADSDGDGLDDGYEILIGSDPVLADSNGNFLSDGDAVQLGISPTGPVLAYNNLLFESFEATSGTRSAWSSYAVSAPAMFNMWHLSTVEPAPSTGGFAIVYMHQRTTSTACRAAFDPGGTDSNATYNLGVAVAMALQSPTITNEALAISNLFVGWVEYYETEPNFDQTVVQVRALPNTNWINISQTMSGLSGVTNINLSNQTARWTYRVADASAFAGKSNVQVRFLFTILNDINNAYRGWWVDDVRLFEGTVIQGWVRDINGRPVQGATVRALGRGGITNRVDGHSYVLPGKVFGEADTAMDGSYRIAGLPRGHFYIKASAEGFRDEFYDGLLFTNGYAFGNGFRPGVFERESVSASGLAALLSAGATTNAHFELEPGQGAPRLGIALPNGSGSVYPVWVNNLAPSIWNGSTSAPATATYLTSTNPLLAPNFPDWLTNSAAPTYLADLAPGRYGVHAGTNLPLYPGLSVDLREGESTFLSIATNQAASRLYVTVATGGPYRVMVNGQVLTNLTPAQIGVLAGPHEVTLVATGASERFTTRQITAPIGGRVDVLFTESETAGAYGGLRISAKDAFGNAITGLDVFVNGIQVTTNELVDPSFDLPTIVVTTLRTGSHNIALRKPGYRATAHRPVTIFSGVTNETEFVLYESDADFDRVGDALEIESYTNLFLYHRDDDPENGGAGDGLNNLLEFDLFRLFGVRLNIFNADSDGDGIADGLETGYDGITNRYAYSVLYTNAIQFTPEVQALFVGRYLDGIDNFGDGTGRIVSIEGDRFIGDIVRTAPAVPTIVPSLTIFTNIVTYPSNSAVSVGHVADTPVFADGMPHRVDSDGDGMWDGFEYLYRTNAALDLLDLDDPQRDPDSDDLVNHLEFLGTDGIANTNDWTNPGKADTDSDFMPDGWEYQYGLDPRDPADAFTDLDGDGLVNLAEFLAGTSPRLRDTDADYLSDYYEVLVYLTDPTDPDTDGDGLLDGREVWDKDMDGIQDGGFFPMWAGGDLDGDGLTDGPTDWDTDGDGMPDGFEVLDADGNIRPSGSTLNPYDPTDGDEDGDGDGLSNLQEYLVRDALFGNHPSSFPAFNAVWYGTLNLWYGGVDNGWNFDYPPFAVQPPIWDYATDPFDADTDGDGIPDGYEVLNGLHPGDPVLVDGTTVTRFYPLGPKGDPDFDGLWNEREYRLRFAVDGSATTNDPYGASTRPWVSDTDGDGLDDGIEHHTMLLGNPTLQDTDGDRLLDGVAVTGKWGEVESAKRARFEVVTCVGCDWLTAFTTAQTLPHPDNPSVFGQLATFLDAREFLEAMSIVPAGLTNIAIGAWAGLDDRNIYSYQNVDYLTGNVTNAPFTFANFGTNLPARAPGVTNSILINSAGQFYVVDAASPVVEHMLVEWRDVPAVTNHYDAAYNDLWQLVFPSDAGLGAPYWLRIAPTNAPDEMPAARWGHGMTYVPGYEIKDQRNDKDDRFGEGTHALLDNRKLVVIGGGDGATKFGDVWEFWVKSNAWTRSQQILNNAAWDSFFAPEPAGGLSELSAVLLMGYSNTKDPACPCGDVSWDCEGIRFGEPKNRPWDRGYGDSSYDLTYILGGWNNENQYSLGEPMDTIYYKSTDDLNDLVEESRAYNNNLRSYDVWQSAETRVVEQYIGDPPALSNTVVLTGRTRIYADLSRDQESRLALEDGGVNDRVPLGPFAAEVTAATNATEAGYDVQTTYATNRATGIRIEEFPFRDSCDRLIAAELVIKVTDAPTNDLDLYIVAEYNRSAPDFNPLSEAYVWNDDEQFAAHGTPVERADGRSFVTSVSLPFTITNGFTGELPIDVTALLLEVYVEPDWEGRAIGFVITNDAAETESALMEENFSFLRITHNPKYRVPAQWHLGSRAQTVQGEVPSQRKSFAMAYNYINDRIIVFGGINGNGVLGDTYEGTPVFGEEDEELPLGTTPSENSDLRKVRLVYWNKVPVTPAPAPRWGHSVCYDDVNNRVLIFGGFDKDNRPLNDLWAYTAATVQTNSVTDTNGVTTITTTNVSGGWLQITDFQDSQRPSPRAGAAMAFIGGQFYRDDNSRYRISGKRDKVVIFGGTDGVNYYNDTWYYDEEEVNYDIVTTNGSRWVLADPGGEQAVGPEPRAFGQMVFAQNAIIPSLFQPELGVGAFAIVDGDTIKPDSASLLLFGGRRGALPRGSDTDRDLVPDGQEHELGGVAAGRDPRVNALYRTQTTNAALETIPYTYRRLGSWGGYLPGFTRPALADLEALNYQERLFGWRMGNRYPHAYAGTFLTWQGYPLETSFTGITYEIGNETLWPVEDPDTNRLIYLTGVQAYTPDWTNQWFHQPGLGNPETARDEWELGRPDNSLIGSNGAPPYAYSGRWVYGTDLRGNYAPDAVMELYSPIFGLQNPPATNTATGVDNDNDFFLVYHEWLDLADSNDVVRLDVVRPATPADIATRVTGLDRPVVTLIPNRNNAANTKGKWRRMIVPLNVLGNDSNLYFRFTLQSDTNNLTAGGWYIDDIAILQGGEISGLLAAGSNTEVCLLGENFNDHVQDCALSDTNGVFEFGFLPLGNYQLVSPLGTNGPIILAGPGVSTNLSAGWLPPVFTSIAINSPLVIQWSATNGAVYSLDVTTNLLAGVWSNLYMVTSSADTALSYTDPVSTIHRVYRVWITNGP